MEKFVKIKIEINDNFPKYCDNNCDFLEDFYSECLLFREELCGDIIKDITIRCKRCLEFEVKDENI